MDSGNSTDNTANRQIVRASGTVMIAFVIGQVFSFAYSILANRAFGTSLEMDAFMAANKFPDILYQLVAGGALASAFIPTFTALLEKGERNRGWKLASAVVTLITLILLIVGILAAIFAPWIVRNLLLSGSGDPLKIRLTVDLMRIQLIAPILFGISGLSMGILNSYKSFLFPALAPAFYSVGRIIGVLLLAPSMGIYGLAVGVVAGACMHGLVQLPALFKLPEMKYSFTLGLGSREVREVARLMGPRLLGVAFVQLNFLVNYNLASGLGDGPLSGINIAFTLMMMVEIVLAQSIAIAAFPTFSAQVANGKLEDLRGSLAVLLRGLLFLSIPASIGMIVLRTPLIALIYQGGRFDLHSTQLVAWALLFYTTGLVGFCVVEIISRAFYALHDTKTPVFVGIVTMSINIGLSFLFLSLFPRWGWMPHGGLALAMTLASYLEMAALIFFMRRRLGGLQSARILNGLVKSLLAGGGMALALWGWMSLTAGKSVWLVAPGGIVIGVVVYALGLALLRVPEWKMVWERVVKILARLGGRKAGAG